MSYTPHTWATGDVITAARLNNMENGIEEANDPYAGYDLVIVTSSGGNIVVTGEVVKGSYADIRQKLMSLTPFTSKAITIFEYGDITCYEYASLATLLIREDGEYPNATYDDYIRIELRIGTDTRVAYWLPDGTLSSTQPT